MSVLIALAAAAATLSGSYDCTFDHQAIVTEAGVQPGAAVSFDGADRDHWRFGARLRENRNAAPQVEITWPGDPIQVAGTHAAIDVGPGHYAFVAMHPRPCMFTETNCVALIQLSARADGSAAFTIMPSGLSGDEANGRSQFHVIFTGTCRRQNGS
jgi:hypothetical protein